MTQLPDLSFAPLRRALLFNAVFSVLTGLLLLVEPACWVPHLAHAPALSLQLLGSSLLGFAGWLVWLATRPRPSLALALGTTLADAAWVTVSAVLLAVAHFSSVGFGLVAGVALVVLLTAFAQLRGIWLAIHAPDSVLGTQFHYRVGVDVDEVSSAALWPIVADLGRIADYYPDLERSVIDRQPGLGAVRSCSDRRGAHWREEVIGWQPGSALDLRFRADDPGFPLPLNPMVGGWRLDDRRDGGTRVTIWWSFTIRPPWAALLVVPMMDARLNRSMEAVVRRMAGATGSSRSLEKDPQASGSP